MVAEQRAVAIPNAAAIVEKVVIEGDLSKLSPAERVGYYREVCASLGLNPLTKPFDYITLNNKLTLYAKKDAADQLRKRDSISVTGLDCQVISDVYVVKAQARTPDGRTDMATGAVSIKGLGGEALANAMLKAETKAKRRVTLSICGLGMLDETEVQDVADAKPVHVDMATGEVRRHENHPDNEPVRAGVPVDGTWENIASEPEHEEPQKQDTKPCPIHGDLMYRREKDGKVWYSHKCADEPKGWCYGGLKAQRAEQPAEAGK